MSKIILASTSPRRKELLEREGIDFKVDASFIDETLDDSFSKSASDWGSKASSLFDQGKQKLQEWFGQ